MEDKLVTLAILTYTKARGRSLSLIRKRTPDETTGCI